MPDSFPASPWKTSGRLPGQLPIVRITLNTLTVAVLVTACKLLTSILAAYAFVFTEFRGKNVFYFVLISTIFIPFTVTMIPNYITVSRLNLFDSVLGIVLPQLADATGIFLLRQTMRSIPKSLIEIAGLDGISRMPGPSGTSSSPSAGLPSWLPASSFSSTPGMSMSGPR